MAQYTRKAETTTECDTLVDNTVYYQALVSCTETMRPNGLEFAES